MHSHRIHTHIVHTQELLEYLRGMAERAAKWNQVKVLLVGEENVGKTSIARFLVTEALAHRSCASVRVLFVNVYMCCVDECF